MVDVVQVRRTTRSRSSTGGRPQRLPHLSFATPKPSRMRQSAAWQSLLKEAAAAQATSTLLTCSWGLASMVGSPFDSFCRLQWMCLVGLFMIGVPVCTRAGLQVAECIMKDIMFVKMQPHAHQSQLVDTSEQRRQRLRCRRPQHQQQIRREPRRAAALHTV
jgi:hypothetical protein